MDPTQTPTPKNRHSIVSTDNLKPRHTPRTSPRLRGLDEIKPFLRQVEKIVTEECPKHDKAQTFPWYKTWESWSSKKLLEMKSWNTLTDII